MNMISNNLPLQLSSFIGREREIAEVTRLLASSRLVTLTGAGGCGKTRLALQIADRVQELFPAGVWFIDLAPITDPSLIPLEFVAALHVHEQPGQPLLNTLVSSLLDKRILLLCDNCEHLIEACAHLMHSLQSACPNLNILATSREALNIPGETIYRVPSLAIPLQSSATPETEFLKTESVQLFVERASAVQPHFALTDQNAAAVAQICARLDGMPLAIELAGARATMFSAGEIAARLDDRFSLLTAGARTALPRQRTLRAAIEWSHDLLTVPERTVFHRLSVFANSWSLDAASEICSLADASQTLELLAHLVNKSLVIAEEQNGQTRYRMLETIREYASEKLASDGEMARLRDQHLAFFVKLAETAQTKLNGPEQSEWFATLERDHDNLRRALEWSLAGSQVAKGLRLAVALTHFWDAHDHAGEGYWWLMRLLAEPAASGPTLPRARALQGAGFLAFVQHDFAHARPPTEAALRLAQELGDQRLVAVCLLSLGIVSYAEHNFSDARSYYEQALAVQRTLGDPRSISVALAHVALSALHDGEYPRAQALLEESLNLVVQLQDKFAMAYAYRRLAQAALYQGQLERAADACRQSVALSLEVSSKQATIAAIAVFAAIRMAQQQPIPAVRLFGATDALRQSTETQLRPYDGEVYDRHVAALRQQLAADVFEAAWSAGHKLSMEDAIAEAQSGPVFEPLAPPSPLPQHELPAGLTAREVEVLRLLAQGLTDAQIADTLSISPRTVNGHLHSIYGKLDVTNRTAAARYAADFKLR